MMMTWINEFWEDESGLGTIELVLLVLILVGLAIVFKDRITVFFNKLTGKINDTNFDPTINRGLTETK